MAKPERDRKSNKEEEGRNTKKEEDRQLSREFEMSFPASDPPSATQPEAALLDPRLRLLMKAANGRKTGRSPLAQRQSTSRESFLGLARAADIFEVFRPI